MSKKTLRFVTIIIAGLLILGMLASLSPMFVSATQAQINQQQQKKNDAQNKLQGTKTKRAKTLEEMERLEKEAGDIQSQIDAVDNEIGNYIYTSEQIIIVSVTASILGIISILLSRYLLNKKITV